MALLQKYDHVVGLLRDIGNAVVTLVSQMAGLTGRVTNLEDGIDDDFMGAWNASTNVPALVAGVGVQNKWYQVTVAGTRNITGVSENFAIGDTVRFSPNGNKWVRVPYGGGGVASVAGKTGVVSLAAADIGDSTAAGRTLLTAASVGAQRGTLGVRFGSTGYGSVYNFSAFNQLSGDYYYGAGGPMGGYGTLLLQNYADQSQLRLAINAAGNRMAFSSISSASVQGAWSEVWTDSRNNVPAADNSIAVGSTGSRLANVYAALATINALAIPTALPSFTVSTVPSSSIYPRGLIYVSDGASSKRVAYSDSSNWRWVGNDAVVS